MGVWKEVSSEEEQDSRFHDVKFLSYVRWFPSVVFSCKDLVALNELQRGYINCFDDLVTGAGIFS